MESELLRTAINKITEMPDEDLALLDTCISRRELKRGSMVLEEGEVCRSFYFVEKGYLRTWYNKDGISINLNFTFEGGFASNLKSFKSRLPSEFTIEAGENTIVYVFEWNLIREQVDDRPHILSFIRRLAVRLLLASEEHSELFKIYTPAERYHFIEKHHPRLLQRVSLSQIASYIGISRETLSRIRAKG
jgi:CRP-like cAMP-binding protein